MDINITLSTEFKLTPHQVESVISLLDEGNTVPFIARYRKEVTGSVDDQTLREFSERLDYLRRFVCTRDKYIIAIEDLDAMNEEISAAFASATTMTELEDIYRPYKKKRRTRATIAKEKGLQPLADIILLQDKNLELIKEAEKYINEELSVNNVDEALQGAADIIAEIISDDVAVRKNLRFVLNVHGIVTVKGNSEDLGVYDMYADYNEAVSKIPGHRILAINRGEEEGFLKSTIEIQPEKALYFIEKSYVKNNAESGHFVKECAVDAYKRLIFPSVEREIRNELTEKASDGAIKVFSTNLHQLLMQPPVKGHVTMGLDPGYRTGCKVAVVDATGKVLDTSVIYAVPPHNKVEQAKKTITDLILKHNVTLMAIGNGTASHETEVFAANLIKELNRGIKYLVVSEAGASVYSASKLGAEEFPDYDVSLRSAVSIARRLQDSLAELVKIDPKSIGVGQYQHDMPQNKLSIALDGVVEDCVNSVGVDLNTASKSLLSHIAGINSSIAENIISYREENGCFKNRKQLLKVPKLGPKAFEQCAGFLRVSDGDNPLDNTGVHPESYSVALNLLNKFEIKTNDIIGGISGLGDKTSEIGYETLAEELNVGVPTLIDIVKTLETPGRDPRDELPAPMLRENIMSLEDLTPGMELKGTVRNVIDFGAFVDIGVHQDGLVHISQITNKFIKHPGEVLKVGDIVTVWVLSVDTKKSRISLTMKGI